MARKIKFALEMADGTKVRSNLEELREHFDLESIMGYYLSGKLQEWLEDRYYEKEADEVANINKDDEDVRVRICEIFGIEPPESNNLSINSIERLNEKKAMLRQVTDDVTIIEHAAQVAFNQEELAELIEENESIIYLCGKEFTIPTKVTNKTYIGVNNPKISINIKSHQELLDRKIILKDVILPECLSEKNVKTKQEIKAEVEIQSLSLYERTKQLYGKEEADAEKMYLECDYDGLLDKFINLSNSGVERANYFIVQMYWGSYGDAVLETNTNSEARQICDNCSDTLAKVQGSYIHNKETGEFASVVDSIIDELRKMADAGDPFACFEIDGVYRSGYTQITQEEANEYLNKASELGNNDATFWIARRAEIAGEYEKAIKYYEIANQNGHPIAQSNLGFIYENGTGVNKDIKKAFCLYTSSAKKGCVFGQKNLADCYYSGKGVAGNNEQAVFWYQKAAEKNLADAQNMLGVCYYNGYGVEQDYETAYYWQEKAAELGLWAAQRNVAGLIFDSEEYGLGRLNKYDGIKWLEKAIDEGDNISMKQLADYYMRDNLLRDDEDVIAAYNLYTRAADSGNEEAKSIIKDIEDTDNVMKMRAIYFDVDYSQFCPLLLREKIKNEGYFFVGISRLTEQESYRNKINDYYMTNERDIKELEKRILFSYAKGYDIADIVCIYINYDYDGLYVGGNYEKQGDMYHYVDRKCIRKPGPDETSLWILTVDAIILHDTNGFLYVKEKSFFGSNKKVINDLKIPYTSITSVEIVNQKELIILYEENKNVHINLEVRNKNEGIGCWTEVFNIARFLLAVINNDNNVHR